MVIAADSSLALLEVGHLAAALMVADRCVKSAGAHLASVENTDAGTLCLKLVGHAADVAEAGKAGVELAQRMGSDATLSVLLAPTAETVGLVDCVPNYSPLMGAYDALFRREETMDRAYEALGLLETQGLVAGLHATDVMLKASNVRVVGKEKIGGGFVTMLIEGDIAAVQAAIDAGRQTVERLGGTLILADVISNPHPDLTALLS